MPYLSTDNHKRIRKSALPLFTPSSINGYIVEWEREMRAGMALWIDNAKNGLNDIKGTEYEDVAAALELRPGTGVLQMRSRLHLFIMNASIRAIVGLKNLPKEVTPARFAAEYSKVNSGLMGLPINIPGTTLYA
ncbi:hypothetical protein HDU93_002156, partial [Gonapodya sp. JEL0774]